MAAHGTIFNVCDITSNPKLQPIHDNFGSDKFRAFKAMSIISFNRYAMRLS